MDKLILLLYFCLPCPATVLTANTTFAPNETSPVSEQLVNQTQNTQKSKLDVGKPWVISNPDVNNIHAQQTKLETPEPNQTTTVQTKEDLKNLQKTNLTKQNNNGHSDCKGWCFREVPKGVAQEVKSTPEDEDKNAALKQKLAMMQSAVNKRPYLSVKVGFNLYADSNQYNDGASVDNASLLADKNVVRVPGDAFYPYTRISLRDLLEGSAMDTNPEESRRAHLIGNKDNVTSYVNNNLHVFANQYFQSNPVLYNMLAKAKRRVKSRKRQNQRRNYKSTSRITGVERSSDELLNRGKVGDLHSNQNRENHDYKNGQKDAKPRSRKQMPNRKITVRDRNIKSRTVNIDDFVFGRLKHQKRFQSNMLLSPPVQVRDVLGMPQEETMIGLPDNEVNDVVAGMKIKSNTSATFVIGATQQARSKINKWIGPNTESNRRSKTDELEKSGVVLEGETKTKGVDKLLKSMTTNYQYESKNADEKKH